MNLTLKVKMENILSAVPILHSDYAKSGHGLNAAAGATKALGDSYGAHMVKMVAFYYTGAAADAARDFLEEEEIEFEIVDMGISTQGVIRLVSIDVRYACAKGQQDS